jgi:hypothetical protein
MISQKWFCRMVWFRGWWKGYTRFRMLRMPSENRGGGGCKVSFIRIVHDKDINDYQVARSKRADDEVVSRL